MKKSIFGKIGAAAVVLTLVTSSLVGGTFAKYVTNASGSATATLAKWGVTFKKDASTNFDQQTVSLEGTGNNKTLLPGDKGKFDIIIDGSQAEVGFEYSISLTRKDGTLTDAVKFYETDARTEAVTEITGEMGYGTKEDGTTNKTVTVYWALPANTEGADGTANDKLDTEMAGKAATYTIDMTASQYIPKAE